MASPHTGNALPYTASARARNVHEQLFTLLKQWGHCDLVLDRQLSDPLGEQLPALAAQQLALPINPPKAALPPDECLMLARLTTQELELFDSSIDISLQQNTNASSTTRAIGGWLFSQDTSLEHMAQRLEQAMIVNIAQSPKALLRLWDPRVIGHLPRILSPQQLALLLGPIACWAWIDRSGQLQTITQPARQDTDTGTNVTPLLLPLRLSAAQDAAIDRIEYINTVLKALAGLGHHVHPSRDSAIDALLHTAQRKRHTQVTDLLSYTLHAVLINPSFDAIVPVQEAIQEAASNQLGLSAALDQFDDDFWAPHKTPADHWAAPA
jgi:Domain of unknown function (DUF4123)